MDSKPDLRHLFVAIGMAMVFAGQAGCIPSPADSDLNSDTSTDTAWTFVGTWHVGDPPDEDLGLEVIQLIFNEDGSYEMSVPNGQGDKTFGTWKVDGDRIHVGKFVADPRSNVEENHYIELGFHYRVISKATDEMLVENISADGEVGLTRVWTRQPAN